MRHVTKHLMLYAQYKPPNRLIEYTVSLKSQKYAVRSQLKSYMTQTFLKILLPHVVQILVELGSYK